MDAPDTPTIGQPTRRSDVELRLPADGAYVSVLRTAASGLAARLDFTIDDIEDVRMAVSEACALALPEADDESDLVARVLPGPGLDHGRGQRDRRRPEADRLRLVGLAGAVGADRRGDLDRLGGPVHGVDDHALGGRPLT